MVFETIIKGRKKVAKGTCEITFKRPEKFVFKAGQYIQIAIPELLSPDSRGNSRLFSVTSSPDDLENIRVVFRVSTSGFKQTLVSMPVGATVQIEQAAGSFVLPQSPKQQQIFVAGGVGISPFMSYFNQENTPFEKGQTTLFYGNQNEESAAYVTELRAFAKRYQSFSLQELYERPSSEFFRRNAQMYKDATWWVVGPPAMVGVVVNGLQLGGVDQNNIITEPFEGY